MIQVVLSPSTVQTVSEIEVVFIVRDDNNTITKTVNKTINITQGKTEYLFDKDIFATEIIVVIKSTQSNAETAKINIHFYVCTQGTSML